ncbi:MAG: nitroreductase family protein [Clostridia bacterium]|nr:nitroreductase family protein [Clostridia bacterium]
MDFMTLAAERYSVRKFKNIHLTQEKIEKILQAGHLAPTGCNAQPQRILVLNTDEAIEKLRECTRCHFEAPTAMLVCFNKDECWNRKYDGASSGPIDASIVTTHMMLEAWEIGVGTTWVMHFNPFKMREQFNIPENIEPVALLVMGEPADDAAAMGLHNEFRDMSETVVYGQFQA